MVSRDALACTCICVGVSWVAAVCAPLTGRSVQGAVPEDYNPDTVILQDQLKKMEKEQKMKEEAAAKAEEDRFEALKNELSEEGEGDKVGVPGGRKRERGVEERTWVCGRGEAQGLGCCSLLAPASCALGGFRLLAGYSLDGNAARLTIFPDPRAGGGGRRRADGAAKAHVRRRRRERWRRGSRGRERCQEGLRASGASRPWCNAEHHTSLEQSGLAVHVCQCADIVDGGDWNELRRQGPHVMFFSEMLLRQGGAASALGRLAGPRLRPGS